MAFIRRVAFILAALLFATIPARAADYIIGPGDQLSVEAAYQYTRVLYRQTETVASQNVVYLLVALRYPVVE